MNNKNKNNIIRNLEDRSNLEDGLKTCERIRWIHIYRKNWFQSGEKKYTSNFVVFFPHKLTFGWWESEKSKKFFVVFFIVFFQRQSALFSQSEYSKNSSLWHKSSSYQETKARPDINCDYFSKIKKSTVVMLLHCSKLRCKWREV